MFRIKLLFLLLPLAISVKAVEIINELDVPVLEESRWNDSSSQTLYDNNSQGIPKQIHVESLDSSNNFSPVPLRHVPKPISYGSFGIAKVTHTTPMPIREAIYVTDPSTEQLYPEKFSGAPLRFVSSQPPVRREESTIIDNVVKVNPEKQHVIIAQNNPRTEARLNENSRRPAERDVHLTASASSAPSDGYYAIPTVTSTTYRPDFESQVISSTPVLISNAALKKNVEEPIGNVIPKPNHNEALALKSQSNEIFHDDTRQLKLADNENRFIEHGSPIPISTISQAPHRSSFTVLPNTITVMKPTEIPLTIDSNPTMSTIRQFSSNNNNHGLKEMRLDFTCDRINAFYSIEKNCDKFVECKDDVAKLYRCPPGLHFNSRTVWPAEPCEDKYTVGCDTSLVPPVTPKPNLIINSLPLDFNCAAGDGYYNLESNCEQFIDCKENVATLYECPSGWHFNNKKKYGENPCDLPSVAQCNKSEAKLSAIIVSRHVDYVCPSNNGYFKIDNECEEFIKCERSIASSYKCFAGLQFNQNALWGTDPCESSSKIRCNVPIPPEPEFSAILVARPVDFTCPSSHGYYKMENDCEQFIKCEHSVALTYKCFSGLEYNHDAAWGENPCASASIVRCSSRVIPSEPKFSATLIGGLTDYTCPSSHAYYKRGNNCDEFIKCERFIAFSYKCFHGLQFNHNAEWGEDPCAKESVIRCHTDNIPPAPKFSAVLVVRMESYVCPLSSGYFRIDNDCEQFVKCDRSLASMYKCLSGLQFNQNATWQQDPCASETIVRCHIKIVTPTPKFSAILVSKMENHICLSENGYYKIDNDCEQFIKCERSIAYVYKCSSGLQYNHNVAWGEDPCASESIIRCKVIPPEPKFSATLIGRVGYTCPSSHAYYKRGNNCDEFIKCERFIAFSYKCLSGLQFNHNAEWGEDPCAKESIIRCNTDHTPPAAKFSAVLISRLEEYVCSAANGYYRLATNNCEQFVKCERSLPFSYKCFTGLQFNANARWGEDPCALPSIAQCVKEVVTPAILISSRIEYTCDMANGYFRKADECEQFIECKHNVPSLYKCPAGLQFDPKTRWGENPCGSSSVVRCQVKVLTYILITKHLTDYTCPAPTGHFTVKDHCEQFIECQDNIPSLYMCKNGLHFNRHVPWGADPCATKSVARCEYYHSKSPIHSDDDIDALCPQANGYFPLDHTECSKYVVCENGFARIMPCPSGLVFNATLQACDWPVNVPSCNPIVFEGFTCPSPTARDGAYDEKISHFRYGNSCKMYIACQEGRPRLLGCDHGRYFDEETRQCIDSNLVHNCKEDLQSV